MYLVGLHIYLVFQISIFGGEGEAAARQSPLSWTRLYISLYNALLCNLFRPYSATCSGRTIPRSGMPVKLLAFIV